MRIWGLLLVIPAMLGAQSLPAPASALTRGVLLERDPQANTGEFSVRAADNRVFRYRFDAKTYVERDDRLIDVSRLQPGESVEVLSDPGLATLLRYARTVHVLAPAPIPRPLSAGRFRAYRTPAERFIPTGNLTFSGVVYRLNSGRLVLHTRAGGDQAILLRQDTRYVEDGTIVESGDLKPNMRVFVRAGRNLYDEVEAYQVVWGQILQPVNSH
jgi:hypothetical protein